MSDDDHPTTPTAPGSERALWAQGSPAAWEESALWLNPAPECKEPRRVWIPRVRRWLRRAALFFPTWQQGPTVAATWERWHRIDGWRRHRGGKLRRRSAYRIGDGLRAMTRVDNTDLNGLLQQAKRRGLTKAIVARHLVHECGVCGGTGKWGDGGECLACKGSGLLKDRPLK